MYLCLPCCGGCRGEGKAWLNFTFEVLYSGSEVSVTYSKVIMAPSVPSFFCRPLKTWSGPLVGRMAHAEKHWFIRTRLANFDVLLTVHLSIFILVINQLDAQNLFYNKFISCLYMFRATYRCDYTRGCIIQFWLPDDEHMVLETCTGMK